MKMKKSKISLENLKVKSFITSFDTMQSKTVKGGDLVQISGSNTDGDTEGGNGTVSAVRTQYNGCPQPSDNCPSPTVLCNTAANVCETRIPCRPY